MGVFKLDQFLLYHRLQRLPVLQAGQHLAGGAGLGRNDPAGGLWAVKAGVVVGGRDGMRGWNDRPGGFSTWPGPALAVPSATAAGVIDGGAPVENARTSWYTTAVTKPLATLARNQDHERAEPDH